MSDHHIPRVARPMIGWAVGTALCDHSIPIQTCDWCREDDEP